MDKKKRRKYKPEVFLGKKADCPQSGTASPREGYCTDSGTKTYAIMNTTPQEAAKTDT